MSNKTKTTRTAKPQPEEKKENQFSFEFLDALSDTASCTLSDYLKKTNAPKDVIQLADMICCIFIEQENLLEGRKQDVSDVADKVIRTVHSISALDGDWYGPTGSITPLKERRVMYRRELTK